MADGAASGVPSVMDEIKAFFNKLFDIDTYVATPPTTRANDHRQVDQMDQDAEVNLFEYTGDKSDANPVPNWKRENVKEESK